MVIIAIILIIAAILYAARPNKAFERMERDEVAWDTSLDKDDIL